MDKLDLIELRATEIHGCTEDHQAIIEMAEILEMIQSIRTGTTQATEEEINKAAEAINYWLRGEPQLIFDED